MLFVCFVDMELFLVWRRGCVSFVFFVVVCLWLGFIVHTFWVFVILYWIEQIQKLREYRLKIILNYPVSFQQIWKWQFCSFVNWIFWWFPFMILSRIVGDGADEIIYPTLLTGDIFYLVLVCENFEWTHVSIRNLCKRTVMLSPFNVPMLLDLTGYSLFYSHYIGRYILWMLRPFSGHHFSEQLKRTLKQVLEV